MKIVAITFSLIFTLLASTAQAQTFKNVLLKITNTSSAIYFAPLAVASHGFPNAMFEAGTPATPAIEAMAEFGNTAPLITDLTAAGAFAVTAENAVGALAPGESIFVGLVVGPSLDYISIAGMLVPTNDGFVGLNSYQVPLDSTGQITLGMNGYDAGTEENNELRSCPGQPPFVGDPLDDPNVPGNPGLNDGVCGTGAQGSPESPLIHVHRGNLGDLDLTGGVSDLDSRVHRWLNPIAKVTIFY